MSKKTFLTTFLTMVIVLVVTSCGATEKATPSIAESNTPSPLISQAERSGNSGEKVPSEAQSSHSLSDAQQPEITIVDPVPLDTDDEMEEMILLSVQTLLEDYKNGKVDTTIPANTEPRFFEMPEDFLIPEISSYDQLEVLQNEMTGSLFAIIESTDGKWQMAISLNGATFHMGDGTVKEPDYAPIGGSFMELK